MVWNVHPHFVRRSSGFVAAEGEKKSCSCYGYYGWLCSANSWTNPAQSSERREMGPAAAANLLCRCFQIRPDTFQDPLLLLSSFYPITYPIPTPACGVIWGTTSWIPQRTSQRNCPNWAQKPTLYFPSGDEEIVRGEGKLHTAISDITLLYLSMCVYAVPELSQKTFTQSQARPKERKKKAQTLMLIPTRLVGSWPR